MEHYDLVAEIPVVEKMSPMERLVHARKRRAHQLKQYRRYEKKIDKEITRRRKPNSYSSKRVTLPYKRGHVDFANNIKLLEAAARNDVEEVHELLMNDVSPDLTNEDGLTALHQCCIDESKKLMQLLLEFGANINAQDSELWTPMHAAATCGHIQLCEILINHNADLLAVNADGNMPYDICDDEETLDLIENEMAKRGITQDQIDETREAKERHMYYDLVDYVDRGGDLRDIRDHNGVTPLHVAAANGYLEVAKYLLDHNVPVNPRDDETWEPIHAAACWQESLMLELLVEYGADIDSKTKKNDAPFDICDDPDIKQKILDMKDAQESQKRRSSGSVRRINRPNNRSTSSTATTASTFSSYSSASHSSSYSSSYTATTTAATTTTTSSSTTTTSSSSASYPANCLLTSSSSFLDKAFFRASLRRSSMRGEKSALFMKEAKEEAAHFGVIDLKSSHHITEEDDDEDEEEEEEEEEEVSVTCVDDVELIMGDTKENNTPNLPSVTSQTSYYNGDATAPAKDRNRGLKSSDSSHSRIADAVLLTQKYKAQAITAPPTESSKSNNNNNYNNNSNYSSSSSISSSSKLSARSPSNSRAAAALGMANSRGISSSSSSTSNSRTASPRTNTRTASPATNARTSVSAVNNTPRGIPSIQSSSSPDLRPTSIATTTTTTAAATTIINTSLTTTTAGAGLTRQSRVADSRRSFEASKSSQKSPPLETNLGYPTKRIGSTSPDVSALANKFNSLSSNANTMKPLETTLGRPVSNSGLNSNRSSKTSVKENRKPSGDISQTRNNNNYNTAVSQTIEAPANNMGRAGGRPAKGSTEQPRNHKLVNGSDSYDRSLNGSTKKTTSVITLTPSDTPAHSNKTPAPLSASQSAVKAPVPPGHSTAPKSSDISTLSSRLKDNSRGDRSSFKDSKAGVNMAPTTITTTTTTTTSSTTTAAAANPASGKASSDAKTSSTSRPVDVRGPRRNTDNTAPSSDAKANQVSQLERDAKRESTKKGSDSAPKKPEVRGSTNIPYESESGSKPVRTLDEDYATTTTTTTTTTFNATITTTNTNSSSGGTIKGMPQLEPRYPSNRSTGCTLSDLKRQRQANYNRRGSGGSEKLVPPAADNPRAVLPVSSTTVPKLQPNWHKNPSPALSSKIPGHAGANAPNAALTNGNKDSVSKYSAPSTVQVVGDDDRKCCCAIM